MNCKLCQQELEAYLEGRLPQGTRDQVDAHLSECIECRENFLLMSISEKVISEEKQAQVNPFIATRVMNAVENYESKVNKIPAYQKVLKPVLISFSISAAILTGVLIGGIYKPSNTQIIPSELVYMDDAAIESVSMFSKE